MIKIVLAIVSVGLASLVFLNKDKATKVSNNSTSNKVMNTNESPIMKASIYDIAINSIDGKKLDLSAYKGKKLLIVNVASECGFTPQYKQLQELYDGHKSSLVVLGCPSNDFGGQEPGDGNAIVTFCQKNYGVTFPLTEKLGILKETHPLYAWLTKKENNGIADHDVKWNFTKFLIDEKGVLIKSLPSTVSPIDEQILEWVDKK